jgi:hypothetical protein
MSIQLPLYDRRREGKIIIFDEWDFGNRHLGLLFRPSGSWKVKGNLSNLETESSGAGSEQTLVEVDVETC